jgi:large subunit ribosomal protein L17
MRHRKKVNHLGRTTAHRKALLKNLSIALIKHKRINTTVPKAKELRKFIEPIITLTKNDTTANRRLAFAKLQNKDAVKILFDEIAPKVADRPGGYTRILKTGYRIGDAAHMCMIELVDFNEEYTQSKTSKAAAKPKTRRGGGRPKKTTTTDTESKAPEEKAEEQTTPETTSTSDIVIENENKE